MVAMINPAGVVSRRHSYVLHPQRHQQGGYQRCSNISVVSAASTVMPNELHQLWLATSTMISCFNKRQREQTLWLPEDERTLPGVGGRASRPAATSPNGLLGVSQMLSTSLHHVNILKSKFLQLWCFKYTYIGYCLVRNILRLLTVFATVFSIHNLMFPYWRFKITAKAIWKDAILYSIETQIVNSINVKLYWLHHIWSTDDTDKMIVQYWLICKTQWRLKPFSHL